MRKNSAILAESARLLGPDDPPPYRILNPEGSSNAILLCDHASNRLPAMLGDLGLEPAHRGRHIAYDIGAAAVTERLSAHLDAVAIFCNYSRLVIDPNRPPEDYTSIRQISDGTVIPGNLGLSQDEVSARINEIFRPYHGMVSRLIEERRAHGVPAVVSMHSFTHFLKGRERPWHVGILSNRDRRLAEGLLLRLRDGSDYNVADNLPYSGLDPYGYSIERHALPAGLPNALFEIRQDLIRDEDGQAEWADQIGAALVAALEDPATHEIFGG